MLLPRTLGSILESSEASRQWAYTYSTAAFPLLFTICDMKKKKTLKSGVLSVEPNMFSSTLMLPPALGALSNPSQLFPGCPPLAHPPAVGPGKQDVLSPCWLHGSPPPAGLLGSHPHTSFSTEPQPSAAGSSSLPAFHDGTLAWPDEKDSGFFRTYGSTNGLGAEGLSAELQSLPGGATSSAGMVGMDTDDMNCSSFSLEKFNAVLNASSHRQQLQLPPAGANTGSGAAAFASQPGLGHPSYSFLDQEVLSEPRLSSGHQGSLADSQFYDADGVHTDELYQSFPFDNILQSYNP